MNKPDIIDIRSQNRSQWQGSNNNHQFIIIHYLGVKNADNPNLYNNGYGGHFNITRDGKIYQAADYNTVLWHIGTAGYYTKKYPNGYDPTNYNAIGIECSVCYDTDWYFTEATQKSLVKLVRWLMQDLGVGADHVLRHYDVVNKVCPAPMIGGVNDCGKGHNGTMTWDEFKRQISGGDEDDMVSETLQKTTISKTFVKGETRYVNVENGSYLNCRVAPNADAPLLSKWGHLGRGNGVQVILKTADNWALVTIMNEQVGWVNAKYLSVKAVK